MTETTMPKLRARFPGRLKFLIGGLLIVAAIAYLIASATTATAQYYLTIDELAAKAGTIQDRDVKISGAVDGSTISYDAKTLTLHFTIANVPGDMSTIDKQGGLAKVLHEAVVDPNARRLQVVYVGPKPDLLRNEAQAIITGRLGSDGVFRASELLLKCPTRYEQAVPLQSNGA
jgi:cytochrome c-type biogenesis protein CcmE